MTISVNASFFNIDTTDSKKDVEKACIKYATRFSVNKKDCIFSFKQYSKEYGITNVSWDADKAMLTGTIWYLRDTGLPSKFKAGEAKDLGMASDEKLGEAASFAYKPKKQMAIMQYNHTGPRHPLIRNVLVSMGLSPDVTITPVLTKNALEQLRDCKFIRRMEFTLSNNADFKETTLNVNAPINHALNTMKELGGVRINVSVSMAYERGGLKDNVTKKIIKALEVANGVENLKASLKMDEEQAAEVVDFFGSTEQIELSIPVKLRRIDHAKCCQRLCSELHARSTK